MRRSTLSDQLPFLHDEPFIDAHFRPRQEEPFTLPNVRRRLATMTAMFHTLPCLLSQHRLGLERLHRTTHRGRTLIERQRRLSAITVIDTRSVEVIEEMRV
jgi:hypothetical protein